MLFRVTAGHHDFSIEVAANSFERNVYVRVLYHATLHLLERTVCQCGMYRLRLLASLPNGKESQSEQGCLLMVQLDASLDVIHSYWLLIAQARHQHVLRGCTATLSSHEAGEVVRQLAYELIPLEALRIAPLTTTPHFIDQQDSDRRPDYDAGSFRKEIDPRTSEVRDEGANDKR